MKLFLTNSVACDKLQLKLSTYTKAVYICSELNVRLQKQCPSIPDGVLEPKQLTFKYVCHLLTLETYLKAFLQTEKQVFMHQVPWPFSAGLILLNHMFLDTLRDSIIRGLENVLDLFAQYNVVPVDPTVDLFARSGASRRRRRKKKYHKNRRKTKTAPSPNDPLKKSRSKATKRKWKLAGAKMRKLLWLVCPLLVALLGCLTQPVPVT